MEMDLYAYDNFLPAHDYKMDPFSQKITYDLYSEIAHHNDNTYNINMLIC